MNEMVEFTEAFGVFEMTGAALVASSSGEARIAGTFAQSIADGRRTSGRAAVARDALRMTEISGLALVTTRSTVTRFADALAGFFLAHFLHCSTRIAITICNINVDSVIQSLQQP